MRVGIFITARLDSMRLPQKHLKLIDDKPILQYLIDRVHAEFDMDIKKWKASVMVVTGNKFANKELTDSLDCRYFYGDDCNIPLRHLQASTGFNAILAIDGDDVLCSRQAMRLVYTELASGAEYVKTEGLPFGMNVFGYSVDHLRRSLPQGERLLETGWGRIFDATVMRTITIPAKNVGRFTLDYQEDFNFFKAVIDGFGDRIVDAGHNEIIEHVCAKGLDKINWYRSEAYWAEFNKKRNAEMEAE